MNRTERNVEHVRVNGVGVALERAGSGWPLVCIHGNFASRRWFRDLLDAPPEGYLVLAPDLPNFGESEAMPEPISIEAYARYVLGLLDALELPQAVLLGHSLGGAVALEAAAARPGACTALVLVASAPPGGFVTPEEHYPVLEAYRTERLLLTQALELMTPTGRPEDFDAFVGDALKMQAPAYTGNARALESYAGPDRLRDVECPVLVVRGAHDPLISEAMARETAAAFRDARLELLADVGHSPLLERPAQFRSLLSEFLEEVVPGGA